PSRSLPQRRNLALLAVRLHQAASPSLAHVEKREGRLVGDSAARARSAGAAPSGARLALWRGPLVLSASGLAIDAVADAADIAHDGLEQYQQRRPQHRSQVRMQKEQAVLAKAPAERLTEQLQRYGREQQNHRPIDLHVSQHAPEMAMQLGEDERREVPDFFFGAGFAK